MVWHRWRTADRIAGVRPYRTRSRVNPIGGASSLATAGSPAVKHQVALGSAVVGRHADHHARLR
jgi:hypothetical protein